MGNLVVYTAITEGYDQLKDPPAHWQAAADFVAFLGAPTASQIWRFRPIYQRFRDPCRNAKVHKILAHKYFPAAEFSLWVDGSVGIKSDLPINHWPEEFLSQHDMAVFRHRERQCLYAEAAVCLQRGLDSSSVIHRQMNRYFREGYPPNNGLAECTVIFRRHTKKIRQFNERWYREILNGSRRDQLSFDYVAHQLGVKYRHLPGLISRNPHFQNATHTAPRWKPIGALSSPSTHA